MKPVLLHIIVFLLLFGDHLFAQTNLQKVTAFRTANEQQIIEEYLKFVAIPDETNDSASIPLNTAYIMNMLEKRGVKAELLRPAFGNPVVFGEVKVQGAA